MKIKLTVILAGLVVALGMMIAIPTRAGMSSANYQIPNDVISGGGSAMSSANYQLVGTIGQSSPLGSASGASYTNYPGFWQADECVFDADSDGLFNAQEYGYGTNAWNPDSDADALNDGEEVSLGLDGYTTDPLLADTDNDNLDDGAEFAHHTNPKSSDSDHDGLGDGEEVSTGSDGFTTNPLSWDSDHDAIPDKFESDNSINHIDNLNPSLAADGALDYDGDGNSNANEYWNGTDPWTHNPVGTAGCFFWGDGNGDGYIGTADLTVLVQRMKSAPTDYSLEIPPTGETQDLNADTYFGLADLTFLTSFSKTQLITDIPTRPVSIEKLSPADVSVQVGNTTRITVALRNEGAVFSPGFGVVFSIDPSSTGTATILGGEGGSAGSRYDVTGSVSISAPSSVVIRVDTAGIIKINASTPQCGTAFNMGRYCGGLNMSTPFTITGN